MYRNFAVVGGVYTVASIVAAAVLVRGRGVTVGWTVAGAPAPSRWRSCRGSRAWHSGNGMVAAAHRAAPTSVAGLWMEQRSRWEYGHAAGFVIQVVGVGALVISILAETPRRVARGVR
jgi:hypothetical protein